MNLLFVDTYYPAFTRRLYDGRPGLADMPFAEQRRAVLDQCFGTSDFYSANLERLGHQAQDLAANCDPLQRRWAAEHAPALARADLLHRGRRLRRRWQHAVLGAQVAQIRPDVLYVQDIAWTDTAWLREVRPRVRLIVGQTAYPLPRDLDLRPYDLILTSFPHYVGRFRAQGVASEYLRLAFEPRVLERIGPQAPAFGAVFVGGVSAAHRAGMGLLEEVARQVTVDFWGYGAEALPAGSPIRQRHHGEAWGLEMYRILAQSRVALNRHIDVAENYANNMRLFEATGVGTCLLTDRKDNLAELFEPDREVAVYSTPEECAERARYLLEHEHERAAIARAGQQRTLREHTYAHRMQELSEILDRAHRRSAPQRRSAQWQGWIAELTGAARRRLGRQPVSHGYRALGAGAQVAPDLVGGWQSEDIPARQRRVVADELRRMYAGERVPVFAVAAEALRATGPARPQVVEIGCASGYYSEALSHLLGHPVQYVGLDYSAALLRQGRAHYPELPLVGADATALPLADRCCEVVFSAALLMHVPDYARAIYESARVSRGWVIFHRTPVLQSAPTGRYAKYAYDVPVVEIVFNEGELLDLFAGAGLSVERELALDGFDLPDIAERASMKTYVCRKNGG